jgi:DNA-binding CsgD family transcriptional regulator
LGRVDGAPAFQRSDPVRRNFEHKRAASCGIGDRDAKRIVRDRGRAARKELRSAGVKLASRASHAAASHGWESLSDTERQVVRLVIGGRTNQQIGEALHLSPRTIGWHLGNIYRKLDVSSRGVLAAEAVRRGFS